MVTSEVLQRADDEVEFLSRVTKYKTKYYTRTWNFIPEMRLRINGTNRLRFHLKTFVSTCDQTPQMDVNLWSHLAP